MLQVKHIEKDSDLAEWHKLRDRIDFEPTYQRKGGIWSLKMKQLFINTILNEYDFPKIYLADFSTGINRLNEHRKQYAVIDGKQRLSTIFSFFDNEFRLDETSVYYQNSTLSVKDLNFESLQNIFPGLAKIAEKYIPTMMGVEADRAEDIYEMFIRLNINVSISGPERRNALPGPIPSLIRKIALHNFFSEKAKFSVDTKELGGRDRGQDLQAAAKLLQIEINNGQPASTKRADLDNMVKKAARSEESVFHPFVNNVLNNLNKMNDLFNDRDPLLGSQAQLTVYYLFVKRHYESENTMPIRNFLSNFENDRRMVKKTLLNRATGQMDTFDQRLDDDFVTYNSLLRSPDDKASVQNMLNILERKFAYTRVVTTSS